MQRVIWGKPPLNICLRCFHYKNIKSTPIFYGSNVVKGTVPRLQSSTALQMASMGYGSDTVEI